MRCPPPAGPPVGLSCRSVLPASWSRLSPTALSAHSYLERPEPAGAAAAMAPPRGRAGLCVAGRRPLAHTWAGGLQMRSRGSAGSRFQMCPPGDPAFGPGSPINPGVLSFVLPSTYFYVIWGSSQKKFCLQKGSEAGVMVHSCKPSTRELQAGGPGVQGQPLLHETLSLKKKKGGVWNTSDSRW